MQSNHAGNATLFVRLCSGLFLSMVILFAGNSFAASETPEATCDIEFSGSSTLHDWSGKAPSLHVILRASSVPGTWDGDLVIPVADLTTDIDARDARMREMFHATQWPEIRVRLSGVDPTGARSTNRLGINLAIRDVRHDLVATLANWKQEGERITFDARVDVSLEQFALDAPRVLGLIRVADMVTVRAHVVVDTHGAAAMPTAAVGARTDPGATLSSPVGDGAGFR